MNTSYFNCALFEKSKDTSSFIQEEIILSKVIDTKFSFKKEEVEYFFSFEKNNEFDWSKPIGIICIKDNSDLLKYTLNNIEKNKVFNHVSFIIVDDRSTEDIKNICKNYPVSYIRVDNKKGFNFSVLNDIAAKIAYDNGAKQIILWNSDLFVPDEYQIPSLLDLHVKNAATISGTKLLYPDFSWNNKQEISENIKTMFPNMVNSYKGTIQFGGSAFIYDAGLDTYFPTHLSRFKKKNNLLASQNKLDPFITGAFLIIDLEWFMESGGLNPSLSFSYQDVDLCLKAYSQGKKVYYFGQDNFLFHDESLTGLSGKKTPQAVSDHILYSKIWTKELYIKTMLGVSNE